MKGAGALTEAVAFDAPAGAPDGYGGVSVAWAERHACAAAWVFARGDEAMASARLVGRSVYKIKVRSCDDALAITTAWRMRDTRRGTAWDIREVDGITDRAWVYLVVEQII